jgi:hypothetical protein
MYIYTAIGTSSFGLATIFAPRLLQSLFGFPGQDPIFFGMLGSVLIAIGLLAIPGLKYPLRFLPVLLLQLLYKLLWLLTVFLPLLISGQLTGYAILLMNIFVIYIAGALIAIPFAHLFANFTDA